MNPEWSRIGSVVLLVVLVAGCEAKKKQPGPTSLPGKEAVADPSKAKALPPVDLGPLGQAVEAFNAVDLDRAARVFTAGCQVEVADSKVGTLHGRKELTAFWKKLQLALPDVRVEPKRWIKTDTVWVFEGVISGSHQGELFGLKPTHRRVGCEFALFAWVNDGLIERAFLCGNPLAVLHQIQAPGDRRAALPIAPERPDVISTAGVSTNVKAVLRFYAAFNKAEWDVLPEILSPDIVVQAYGDGKEIRGLQTLSASIRAEQEVFEGEIVVEETLAAGPFVVALVMVGGKLKKDIGQLKATGNRFEEKGVDVFRLKDGQVVEWINYRNLMDLMAQLSGDKPAEEPKDTPLADTPVE